MLALVLGVAAPTPAAAADPADDGFRLTPSIGWSRDKERIDLSISTRGRIEWWNAFANTTDAFYALRTRVGLKYAYDDLLTLFAEYQNVELWSLSPSGGGANGLYWTHSGMRSSAHDDSLRQFYAELRPVEGLALRGGRFDIKGGTEVMYPEANWKYLKIQRASQRLVGTVGWTHVERSNEGLSTAYDFGDHHLYAFAARPTTGVFDADDAYHRQDGITYGGLQWTVKRDVAIPDTELRFFALDYDDDRSTRDGGLASAVHVYTVGLSSIGIYPVGPGNFDLFAWFAGQWGRYDGLDHLAAAGILEVGYQFPDVFMKPWFRLGVNIASGDGDPNDGDHNTFFNMLPTNHLYYGFADQFAFQNLVNYIAQLMLQPHEKVNINLMLHHFKLQDKDDVRYGGTGAFNKDSFGFVTTANPRRTTNAATEIDAVLNVNVRKGVSVQAGYAHIWSHTVFQSPPLADDDVDFGYVQVSLSY
ncbi:MAG: alginate export family protein [Deltaproteobacteria bacterium]|nr:MAG: alginate export family protein [Deltaproteobacteria bacterium]